MAIPLFALQLASDLFTEMVFVDLDMRDWTFWVILFFDVFMLIARDADLWDDLARVIKKTYGKCGALVLLGMQLLGGDGDDIGDNVTRSLEKRSRLRAVSVAAGFVPGDNHEQNNPEDDPKIRAAVHRQITENWCVSASLPSVSASLLSYLFCFLLASSQKF